MVSSAAKTVKQYLDSLPPDRRATISAVRDVVIDHLPDGYVEGMQYGMIYYYVPLDRYPETYNGHPLCYAGIAAQKNHNALYLMGVYSDGTNARNFKDAFAKAGKTLDMGQSCVRFRSVDDLALDAIGETIAAVPVREFIEIYEKSRLQTKAGQRSAAKSTASESTGRKNTAHKRRGA